MSDSGVPATSPSGNPAGSDRPVVRRRGFSLLPRTFDHYLLRRFGGIFLSNLCVFTLLYVLVDGLTQFEHFLDSSAGFLDFLATVTRFYYYELPGLFCRILGPVTTMTSAMFAATITQRSNELVPVLATGTSLQRTFLPIILVSSVIVGATFGIQEYWIPAHRHEIRAARSAGHSRDEVEHAVFADQVRSVKLIARTFLPFRQVIEGLFIFSHGDPGGRNFIVNARLAAWRETDGGLGEWVLRDAFFTEYEGDDLVLKEAVEIERARERLRPEVPFPFGEKSLAELASERADWEPRLELPEREEKAPTHRLCEYYEEVSLNRLLRERFRPDSGLVFTPQDLAVEDHNSSLSELRLRAESSPDRHRWMLKYYSRFVDPLNHLILILLGLPIILRQGSKNVFLSALIAVTVSAGYFIFQTLGVYLGNLEVLPPYLAVWLGPIIFGSLGLTLYRGMPS